MDTALLAIITTCSSYIFIHHEEHEAPEDYKTKLFIPSFNILTLKLSKNPCLIPDSFK